MALSPLSLRDQQQQLLVLNEISAMTFEMTRDFGAGFTMHEIVGSSEIAVRPSNFVPDDYLRCYLARLDVDRVQLVIDDVIFDADKVDLSKEIKWNSAGGSWDLVDISEVG